MTLSPNLLFVATFGYIILLFAVGFWGERRRERPGLLGSALVYTLSISVYCTSWTFFGAVGSAARSGIEFTAIYLGPTLVFAGWFVLLRKMVHIRQNQQITSIADLISSRYGKSPGIAALVTLIAVVSTLPYIALQLKAVSSSLAAIMTPGAASLGANTDPHYLTAFWVAAGMAAFTILFGTRTLDASERHHGIVAAIALESLVKLGALVSVGLFATYAILDGPQDVLRRLPETIPPPGPDFDARWTTTIALSAIAVLCLPRMFQVTIVECTNERHLRTAGWAFPLYLLVMTASALPIAVAGIAHMPAGSNPDLFVLTLPLSADQNGLALLAFLGGFSSATSMVIISSIALSTMVSNHLIMPLKLRGSITPGQLPQTGDVRGFLLNARRISICVVLLLSFLYYRMSGNHGGLASIGFIAFTGVAQFLPALIAGIFWHRANGRGAALGMISGFLLWAGALFLPSVNQALTITPTDADPLVTALTWSLGVNTLLLILGSLSRDPFALERLQATRFVETFSDADGESERLFRRSAASADLYVLAQRILGESDARTLFTEFRERQGLTEGLPEADDAFITYLERRLASSIGAASARAMVSSVARAEAISRETLIKMADETARLMDHSQRLEAKSQELEETARQLRSANERLRRLDALKDEFLSQVSHELRTPMTSLRSFSEILIESEDLPPENAAHFLRIIHDETLRLTRLLDEILDLNTLENAEGALRLSTFDPMRELDGAIEISRALDPHRRIRLVQARHGPRVSVRADADRLRQVFINVLANAIKYNTNPAPAIWIETEYEGGYLHVRVIDNGPGIEPLDREIIFDKFARSTRSEAKGSGLGLAICRRIMERLDGAITLDPPPPDGGAVFRISLPALPSKGPFLVAAERQELF